MPAAFRTTKANDKATLFRRGNVKYFICITFDLLYQNQSVVEQSLFQFELYINSAPSMFLARILWDLKFEKRHL